MVISHSGRVITLNAKKAEKFWKIKARAGILKDFGVKESCSGFVAPAAANLKDHTELLLKKKIHSTAVSAGVSFHFSLKEKRRLLFQLRLTSSAAVGSLIDFMTSFNYLSGTTLLTHDICTVSCRDRRNCSFTACGVLFMGIPGVIHSQTARFFFLFFSGGPKLSFVSV